MPININKRRTHAIINLKVTGNFISTKFAQKNNVPTIKRETQYKLKIFDKQKIIYNNKIVNTMIIRLFIIIRVYYEEIAFNIIKIAIYNVILGIPWLKRHNFTI